MFACSLPSPALTWKVGTDDGGDGEFNLQEGQLTCPWS